MSDIDARSVQTPALVYVRGLRGAAAQIWHEPVLDLSGYWRGRIVAVHPIGVTSAFAGLLTAPTALAALKEAYPPPAEGKPEPKVKL